MAAIKRLCHYIADCDSVTMFHFQNITFSRLKDGIPIIILIVMTYLSFSLMMFCGVIITSRFHMSFML